ncbi:MAG TPA: alpha/beta hydrolase [Anaerolineae bacterium]|nr:alpha/beta hydrolase [Anaerolineae bacterium]
MDIVSWLAWGVGGVMVVFMGAYLLVTVYIVGQLWPIDVMKSLQKPINQGKGGKKLVEQVETEHYRRVQVIEKGIERISYYPKVKRFDRPIVMQHGMWHGGWCWETWQVMLAEWGWESHAHSLPGHGLSPAQKPVPKCTLDYYLNFLQAEVGRYEKPILMGHSMGGALSQWFLKYVEQELTAVVLVAPWAAHRVLRAPALTAGMMSDPTLAVRMMWRMDAYPMVDPARNAGQLLITEGALYTAEALHERLGNESALVMYQHMKPFWTPPTEVAVPMLVVNGTEDKATDFAGGKETAEFYGADFIGVVGEGHNLMMERGYKETVTKIHEWLKGRV